MSLSYNEALFSREMHNLSCVRKLVKREMSRSRRRRGSATSQTCEFTLHSYHVAASTRSSAAIFVFAIRSGSLHHMHLKFTHSRECACTSSSSLSLSREIENCTLIRFILPPYNLCRHTQRRISNSNSLGILKLAGRQQL